MSGLVRLVGFFVKELREVTRQPSLIVVLILGPFLILFLFGLGHSPTQPPLKTIMVVPPNVDLPIPREDFPRLFGPVIHLVETIDDAGAAFQRLENQEVDLVVLIPANLYDRLAANQQATVRVLFNDVDPVIANYIRFVAGAQVADLNAKILRGALERGMQQPGVLEALAGTEVSPAVIVSPLVSQIEDIAPVQPSFVGFFAPAVLALLLQHIAVTFGALSIVRERLFGAIELFRVAPVSTFHILVGKYLAYLFVGAIVTSGLVALLVFILKVPFIGRPDFFALTIAGLILASIGYGLLVSLLSSSERQAVQLAMLVLIASVFFGGFFLQLETFSWPVRGVAYLLPVTYGIQGLQNVMLRGTGDYFAVEALGILSLILFVLAVVLLKSELRRSQGSRM